MTPKQEERSLRLVEGTPEPKKLKLNDPALGLHDNFPHLQVGVLALRAAERLKTAT